MHLRRIFFLTLLLVGLGFFWWRGRAEDQVFDRVSEQGLAADVESSRVYKLRFENLPRDTAITFERDAQGLWLITDPLAWRAEDGVVRQLLDALRNSPAQPAPGVQPEGVELAPERARVTIHERLVGAPERITTIKVGALDVDGQMVHAERDGQVYRVSRGIRELLEYDLSFYRQKRLVEFMPQEVLGLKRRGRLTQPGWSGPLPADTNSPPEVRPGDALDPADLTLALTQSGQGWELETPFRARVEPNLLGSALMILSQARATAFPADQPTDLAPYGLAPPWFELELDLGNGRSESLRFGAATSVPPNASPADLIALYEQDIWFAQRGVLPNVFRVDGSLVRAITQPALELVDANIFQVRREDLTRFELVLDGPLAEVAGIPAGESLLLRWRGAAVDVAEVAPGESSEGARWRLADPGLISDHLAPLLALASVAVMDPALEPSTVPSGTVRVDNTNGEVQIVEFGGPGELAGVPGQWLRRRGEVPWLFVASDLSTWFQRRSADLLSKAPILLEELELGLIELQSGETLRRWGRDQRNGLWSPEGVIAEDKRFAALIDALVAPKVERWELEAGAAGLDGLTQGPSLTVRLLPLDGTAPSVYRLAKDQGGQVWLEFEDRVGPARVEALDGALELLR